MSERELCQAVCWMDWLGRDAECSLLADHNGLHEDHSEGWEW